MKNYKFIDKLAASEREPHDGFPATAIFFGDSVTKGCFEVYMKSEKTIDTVYEPWNGYVGKFERIINTLYPRAQCNIINSGISGDKTQSAKGRLYRDVVSRNPDLAVVCFGLNDCSDIEHAKEYGENLSVIFEELNRAGIECIFMTPNMINTYISAEIENPILRNIGGQLAQRWNSGTYDYYMETAKSAAQAAGVAVCDCYDIWKLMYEQGVDTTLLLANRLNHPVREFHWIFAYELIKILLSGKEIL